MKCWRIDLQQKFSLYVSGELARRDALRLEDHLLDCGWCRTRLSRIRSGHNFARQMPRVAPRIDPWAAIESAMNQEQNPAQTGAAARPVSSLQWRDRLLKPAFAVSLVIIAVLITGLAVLLNRQGNNSRWGAAEALDFDEFHPVTIADIEHNTEPHVVAEGYVSEISIDREDGDLTFKLVDDIQQDGPFIICEILNPKKMAPPPVGSRVRVYGVSRYDGKEDHQWYEVHPVLNIEMVRR